MDVIFFGAGAFGLPTLRALAKQHRIVGVVSQPDRPAGRGSQLTPTPIATWTATTLPAVPLFKPQDVNEPVIRNELRTIRADAWVVIAFGQKLSAPLLAERFAINLHASLLPRWRGAAPINWAILAGDHETGNSVITLAEKMDAGLILGQSTRTIEPAQTIGELHDLLSEDGPGLVLDVLHRFATNTLAPQEQDPSRITLARKLTKADGTLEFTWTSEECRRKVHGLTPWPGVAVQFRGEAIKLLRVRANDQGGHSQEPGTILDAATGLVACGGGSSLSVLEVQQPGKKAMAWDVFARGARVVAGEKFIGGPVIPGGG
jgi:methionyl-tRNA formyltransferase